MEQLIPVIVLQFPRPCVKPKRRLAWIFHRCPALGFLDRLDTISDYRVLPVVGLVRPSFVWQPDEREVEEVFTLPLELAVSHGDYSHEDVHRDGKTYTISSLQWQGHTIWGVTAAILLNLGSRMKTSG